MKKISSELIEEIMAILCGFQLLLSYLPEDEAYNDVSDRTNKVLSELMFIIT